MNDLTIMYISASQMPDRWMTFQIQHLLQAIDNAPIISVSRKPLNLGTNLLDTETRCYWNIYRQMLRASELATTPFVAMVEDDTLYTKQHFKEFRPPLDAVSYDRSRWSLFAWDPIFCMRQRISNCSLIAPRELLIEALTERIVKHPQGAPDRKTGEVGREKVERLLGVTVHKCVEWYSRGPIVQLNHETGTDTGHYEHVGRRRMYKAHGQIQAIEIPHWGKAVDIAKVYNGH